MDRKTFRLNLQKRFAQSLAEQPETKKVIEDLAKS